MSGDEVETGSAGNAEGPGPQDGSAPATRASGPRFVSNADKLGYSPPLDGMRGLAVSLIVLVHASFVPFASFAGTVDMFFVVSGFLITTLLLEEDRRSGRVNMKRFYTRRALRLLPLMYVVLAGTLLAFVAVHLLFDERALLDRAISDVLAGATYMSHVVHPVHIELVGGGPPPIRPLIQLWSLTVEEHFYLFGTLVILLVVRRRWVTQLMVLFTAAWIFIGIARFNGHVGPVFAWYQRPDSLLLGVVLAFVNARMPAQLSQNGARWLQRAANVAIVVGLATVFVGLAPAKLVGAHVPFLVPEGGSLRDGLYWGEFGFTIVAACLAVVVITFARYPEFWAARAMSNKVLTTLGVRSYAIYLIHVPLGVLLMETLGRKAPAVALLIYLPLLALLVEGAHRFIEKPAMRLKFRFSEPDASGATSRFT